MIDLRDYQTQAVDETREALRSYKRVLLQAPTGAGKTAIAAWMTRSAVSRGRLTYFNCHRQELVDQTSQTFDQVGVPHSFIASGYPYDPDAPVQICSVPTLTRRVASTPEPDFAIWDECHHIAAKTWASILESWESAYQVGLSATPARLDGKGLKPWFDSIVPGPQVQKLIDDGWLSDFRAFSHPDRPDLSKMRIQAGDFHKRDLAEQMSDKKIVGNIIEHYQQLGDDRRALVFAVNIEHSKMLAQAFTDAGISAAHLDGRTPKDLRRSTLQAYATGEYQVICNVALFGEGFDLAANAQMDVTVDCVISARPTMSLGMWMQQCGRCLRPKEDKRPAIILDHAGNALRHGLPDEIREWTLEDQERSQKEGGASVRECPECFCCCPSHLTECPHCGYVWPVKRRQRRDLKEEAGNLSELDKDWRRARAKNKTLELSDADKKRRARELMACRSYAELHELARSRGYRKPAWWAEQRWAERAPQIAEEDACVVDGSWQKTEDNFVALGRKRGMARPIGWARAVMKNRERRGIL